MAKLVNSYPSWVEKYRKAGVTIRKKNSGYGLYKCTSSNVKGKSYPVISQEFLGMVYEDKGFVPKTKKHIVPSYIEYGLSSFIMLNFKRELKRVAYDGNLNIIYLGIIEYIFDAYNETLLNKSYLTYKNEELLTYLPLANNKRIHTIVNNIDSLFKTKINDTNDLSILLSLLRLSVYDQNNNVFPMKDETLVKLSGKYGFKLW